MTPFLELYIFSCRIKTSPNDHALYGIHTNKKYQSMIGLLKPFCSKTLLSLFFSMFSFHKRWRKKEEEKVSLQKLATHTHTHLNPRESDVYIHSF